MTGEITYWTSKNSPAYKLTSEFPYESTSILAELGASTVGGSFPGCCDGMEWAVIPSFIGDEVGELAGDIWLSRACLFDRIEGLK